MLQRWGRKVKGRGKAGASEGSVEAGDKLFWRDLKEGSFCDVEGEGPVSLGTNGVMAMILCRGESGVSPKEVE